MEHLENISCLLVDDDPFMLKTLSKMLESMGITSIIQTDSAQEALRYIANRNNHIDVVITDLNMPEMDGIQLLRHFGSLGMNFSVILVSGEDPRLLESVRTLGVQQRLAILGTLNKPVRKIDLESLLRTHSPAQHETPDGPGAMVFADELQSAILNDDISVYFQPQVSVTDGRIIGVEALARWKHPEKGWIPPNVFIGIAEKYDMIQEITDIVFQKSINEAAHLRSLGFDITVSINFSAQVLSSLELPEVLSETISSSGLEPNHVVIEVTESTLAEDMNVTLDILTRMRLKGFGLSIDDFGTGFSSMEQLRQIPFTELKIDRSFVHQSSENQASRAILESSISLAKRLNISSVAEGVETDEDWNLITELGCDNAQGYYTAKPMPANEFIAWSKEYANSRKS
ncbi:MAG: EAL domain-containing response regulator [Candidatus Pelagadaptatus aseana]|uniref:EAL domain-containing response regulator n=1 Tax=Candidatus Pelagadaptatus aseana TaxID=3120508 RepID=UPI0039B289BE